MDRTPYETRVKLVRATDKIERHTNKNRLGHGEHACYFCDARGQYGDVEHTDKYPLGELWQIVNNL